MKVQNISADLFLQKCLFLVQNDSVNDYNLHEDQLIIENYEMNKK